MFLEVVKVVVVIAVTVFGVGGTILLMIDDHLAQKFLDRR